MPLVDEVTYREFLEFVAAKKRKREKIRWTAKGAAAASYKPSSYKGFKNFLKRLQEVDDFGKACEHLDKLENSLIRRHGCKLPLPRKVLQNEDKSLTLFWEHICVRCLVDGISVLIGGAQGVPTKGITNELLDMLAFQVKIKGI